MDVAKRLVDWTEQPPEQWFTTINRYLPPAVTAVLVVAIAYQLAGITWLLVPGEPQTMAPAARPAAGPGPATSPDLDGLKGSHLFGEAHEQAAAPVAASAVDAPDTTLSLTLTGILAGGSTPQAIISANRSPEKTYHIGDTIDNADGATLYSVEADRVLLNRDGRLETLRLPEQLSNAAPPRPTASLAPVAAQPNGSLRQVISENASRLTDIVRLAPHVQEGKVIGFRVNPGRDRATFDALGLQPGDVVTDINGTVLNDPSQGLQVFESLGESTQANVTVLRDGAPQVVVIDTTQLQKVQEKRE
jgi:general secretion pathway protein C